MKCGGCGENLTKGHWEICDWVTCECGHKRKMHDEPDGCTWISGQGLRCPCKKFEANLSYKEFCVYSKRLIALFPD